MGQKSRHPAISGVREASVVAMSSRFATVADRALGREYKRLTPGSRGDVRYLPPSSLTRTIVSRARCRQDARTIHDASGLYPATLGVTELQASERGDDLMRRIDQALSAVTRSGRNRVAGLEASLLTVAMRPWRHVREGRQSSHRLQRSSLSQIIQKIPAMSADVSRKSPRGRHEMANNWPGEAGAAHRQTA